MAVSPAAAMEGAGATVNGASACWPSGLVTVTMWPPAASVAGSSTLIWLAVFVTTEACAATPPTVTFAPGEVAAVNGQKGRGVFQKVPDAGKGREVNRRWGRDGQCRRCRLLVKVRHGDGVRTLRQQARQRHLQEGLADARCRGDRQAVHGHADAGVEVVTVDDELPDRTERRVPQAGRGPPSVH